MNPSRALPGEFKQLSVLIGVNLVDMIGLMLVLPILPFFASDLGATPERIGWLIAAFSIAQLIAAPFWGRLSDRYGRRPAPRVTPTLVEAESQPRALARSRGFTVSAT